MKSFLKMVGSYRHGLIMVLYMIFYLKAFQLLEARQNVEFHLIHFPLDDLIPFQEAFIIPYLLWFPFIALTILYFIFRKGIMKEYYQLTANLIMGMSIFLLVSWLFPNMLELRPVSFERDNLLTSAVAVLYQTDTSTNVLPSIHVFNSLACELAIKTCPTLKGKHGIQFCSTILTLLIILSTMFLKQHSMIDVFLGSVMALLGYEFFYTPGSIPARQPVSRRQLAYAQAGRESKRQ